MSSRQSPTVSSPVKKSKKGERQPPDESTESKGIYDFAAAGRELSPSAMAEMARRFGVADTKPTSDMPIGRSSDRQESPFYRGCMSGRDQLKFFLRRWRPWLLAPFS